MAHVHSLHWDEADGDVDDAVGGGAVVDDDVVVAAVVAVADVVVVAGADVAANGWREDRYWVLETFGLEM